MKWRSHMVLIVFGLTAAGFGMAAESTDPVRKTPPVVAADPAPKVAARPRVAADRLDLDATVVTGNRELPKVLYIVPWKKAEIGDLPEQPFNSLLDEALTPIDRDEFRREVSYYSKLVDRPAPVAASQTDKAVTAPAIGR
jgi:hypothetical protein